MVEYICSDIYVNNEKYVTDPEITQYIFKHDIGTNVPSVRAALYNTKLWPKDTILNVTFIGGEPWKKAWVEKVITEKFQPYSNIKFTFDPNGKKTIRISFDEQQGAYSAVGTDALNRSENDATMNLGWLDAPGTKTSAGTFTFKGQTYTVPPGQPKNGNENGATVQHEFGHAIGMIHEHQNPRGKNIDWDIPKVYKKFSGPPNNWDKETINRNILKKYNETQINGSDFDAQSIMLYFFPASLTKNGQGTSANMQLSELDKLWMQSAYANAPSPSPLSPSSEGATPISSLTTTMGASSVNKSNNLSSIINMSVPPNVTTLTPVTAPPFIQTVLPPPPPQFITPPQIIQTPAPPQSPPVIIPISTPPPAFPPGMCGGPPQPGFGGPPMCPPPMCPPPMMGYPHQMPMCPPPRSRCRPRPRSCKRKTPCRKINNIKCQPGHKKVCRTIGSKSVCRCEAVCSPLRVFSSKYRRCIPKTCPPGHKRNAQGECIRPSCPSNKVFSPKHKRCIPRVCPPGYRRSPNGECTRPPCPPSRPLRTPNGRCYGLCPPEYGWSFPLNKCIRIRCPPGQTLTPQRTCVPNCPPNHKFVNGRCVPIYRPPFGKIHIHGPKCHFAKACGGARRPMGRGGRGRGKMYRSLEEQNFLEVPNIKGLGPGVIENFQDLQQISETSTTKKGLINYKFLAIIIILIIIGVVFYITREQR